MGNAGIPTLWPRRTLHRWLLVVLLVCVAVGACEWARWPFLRGPLESGLARALDRPVQVGEGFGLRLMGRVRLQTDLLVIGPAADGPLRDGQAPELLRATRLRVELPYLTLWRLAQRPEEAPEGPYIALLAADTLHAVLLRDEDGRATWRAAPAETAREPAAPLRWPRFGTLGVHQARVEIDDAPGRLQLQATLSSADAAGKPTAAVLDARGRYRGEPLTLRARTGDLSQVVAGLDPGGTSTPWLALSLQLRWGRGEFDFDGRTREVLRLAGVEGNFRLAGPSLATVGRPLGLTLPTTGPFLTEGKVTKDETVWSADVARLNVGSSRLKGRFRYDPRPQVPQLTGELTGPRLSMPDLGPAVGGRGSGDAEPTPTRASGRLLPQREFDIPSLAAMNADVAVAIDEFHLGTTVLESIAPLRAHITLSDRVLRVHDIDAKTAQGTLKGAISLDSRRETPGSPLWRADLRWSGVQLERFLKPRNPTAAEGRRGYLSGALEGRAKLQGSGRSISRVLSSADGELQMWVRGGQVSHLLVELLGIDVAQALGVMVGGDEMLPMQCAVTALKAKDGRFHSELMVIETPDSTVSGDGTLSLADESMNLLFRARPKDISPVTLRSPVIVEGRFSDPEVRLDKSAIGKRVAAAAALAVVTPLAALLALIDLGDPEKQVCERAIQRVRKAAP